MANPSSLTQYQIESTPRCCPRCFDDRSVKAFIGRYGTLAGDCDFCGAAHVRTLGIEAITVRLESLFEGYATPQPGVHYIPALEEIDGETLDYLLDADNPGLFAERLAPEARQALVQSMLDVIYESDIDEALGSPSASDYWVRPGSEIWAGAEHDWSFLTAPERWQRFVLEVSHQSRFFRLDSGVDPQTYLTPRVLARLARRLRADALLYRAVIGGVTLRGTLTHHPAERMAGPEREHSKEGLRVNAAGVPVLYAAKDAATAISEVRPWVGAPVSVATLRLQHDVRLVDFRPRRRRSPAAVRPRGPALLSMGISPAELDEIVATIGTAMARPIDPADSQVSYAPTQYVAEVVRRAGFDGLMFQSAVGPGVNVVLFEKSHAAVESVELVEVTGVRYTAGPPPRPAPSVFGDFDADAIDLPF